VVANGDLAEHFMGKDSMARSPPDRIDCEAAPMNAIPPALARRVLDAAPDAMVIIDVFGSIWYANRQVSTLFGYAREEIIGESIEMLMPQRYRDLHIAHRVRFTRNLRVRPMGFGLDLHGLRSDGSEFPLEISLNPIDDADRTLIAAAIRDVSDARRVEAELAVARGAVEALREMVDRAMRGTVARRSVMGEADPDESRH
jgi:PAS domain S-box-containing protein